MTEIIQLTLHTKPRGATHWSCRRMAKQVGVSSATVQRVWHEYRIYPHKVRTFKVSKDPAFLDKLTDVVVSRYMCGVGSVWRRLRSLSGTAVGLPIPRVRHQAHLAF